MVLHMKAAGALFLTFIEGVVKVSMFRYLLAVLSCAPIIALLLIFAPPAEAKRVALVIGNNNYENVPDLEKAVNDARALGRTLKDQNFELISAENLTRREMNEKLQEFAAKLDRGDEALFFFAGHGVQISGQNFLLPTDIPNAGPDQESYVRYEAVGVYQVLDIIRGRGSRVAILILDACRNNPFRREGTRALGGTRGLARMAPPEGTFIMYSAGVGQEALDTLSDNDSHPNSIFTRTLIPFLKTPGMKLTETARRVRRQVQKLAATAVHEQRPAYYDEVTGEFFFVPLSNDSAAPRISASKSSDEILWAAIKDSGKVSDFEFYVSKFPRGRYAAVAELKVKQLKEKKVAVGAYAGKPMAIGEGLPKKPGPARTVKMFNLFCLSLVPEISKIEEAAVARHFAELKGKALKEYQPLFRTKEMRAWSYEDFGSKFVLATARSDPATRFKEEVPEFADSRNLGCSLIFRTKEPKEKVLKEMVDSLGRDPDEVWTQWPRRVHAWTGKSEKFLAVIHYHAPIKDGSDAVLSAMAFVKN